MTNYQLDKIESLRAKIIEDQKINDGLYNELLQELGFHHYSRAEEFLFDAIFNSPEKGDFEYFLQQCQDQLKLQN